MSCDLTQRSLDAYVDDSCTPEVSAAIEAHLRDCPSCTAEALSRLQAKQFTRAAAGRYAPSPEFRLRVETSLRKHSKPSWISTLGFGWRPRLAFSTLALALILASVMFWSRHTASEQAMTELLDLHVATLASSNPVDVVSTDRHTVKPWFQGKLPFTFNLPELQNTPFQLLGARLMYFHHAPGAQLLYEVRKHQISVFILEDKAGTTLPSAMIGTTREKGFSIDTCSESGLRYIILGDTTAADIHALSELLRAAARS
jgi:anti-sigma factor RsiW